MRCIERQIEQVKNQGLQSNATHLWETWLGISLKRRVRTSAKQRKHLEVLKFLANYHPGLQAHVSGW